MASLARAALRERSARKPPETLREIYTSFLEDDAMLKVFLEEKPAVVSFHFGLPSTGSHRGAEGCRNQVAGVGDQPERSRGQSSKRESTRSLRRASRRADIAAISIQKRRTKGSARSR